MLATLRACWISCIHRFETFTVVIMSWLTATEYLCHKWQRICSTCRKQFSVLSFFITWLITGICNKMGATSGAEHAYPSEAPEFNPDVLRGSCCSIFSFLCSFLDCCLSLSLGHCVVCPSLICRFWYHFGIFKLFGMPGEQYFRNFNDENMTRFRLWLERWYNVFFATNHHLPFITRFRYC